MSSDFPRLDEVSQLIDVYIQTGIPALSSPCPMPPRETPSTAILSASPVSIAYPSCTNLTSPAAWPSVKEPSYIVIGISRASSREGSKRRKRGESTSSRNCFGSAMQRQRRFAAHLLVDKTVLRRRNRADRVPSYDVERREDLLDFGTSAHGAAQRLETHTDPFECSENRRRECSHQQSALKSSPTCRRRPLLQIQT